MVDKYLNSGERVIFVTKNEIRVGEDKGFHAFVTNHRLIFLNRRGFVFKKDKMIDTLLRNVSGVELEEKGLVFKKKKLNIKGMGVDFRLFGDHSDLSNLHMKINEQLVGMEKV